MDLDPADAERVVADYRDARAVAEKTVNTMVGRLESTLLNASQFSGAQAVEFKRVLLTELAPRLEAVRLSLIELSDQVEAAKRGHVEQDYTSAQSVRQSAGSDGAILAALRPGTGS